ncbi:MAG: translocation/assembly module TamB domain-containing protein [Rhodobacteraceae bacterium]|nr:translocation/assembly module TamB domain-containing protein [Paracoccaceae bacterium]
MRSTRLLPALALCFGLGTVPVWYATAQDQTAPAEDSGFLERQISNLLGGEGREVHVYGLSGLLSSQATIARIEVADDDGVWLTVRDVALDWRRVALLRRRLEVNALTVGFVDLARKPLPLPGEKPALAADTEAQPFALPELPVSVDVKQIAVGALKLGAPVLGTAATLSVNGSAKLAGGAGDVNLSAVRIDGHDSRYGIRAGFDNQTRQTLVDLQVREDAGGLVSTVAGIPGAPPLTLSVQGDAPLSDFTATIALTTDGQDRLNGTVAVADLPAQSGQAGERQITADLSGDVGPLFKPEYRDFFGHRTVLALRAVQGGDAGLDVTQLDLTTQALNLSGTADLNAAYLPETVKLTAQVAMANGLPVVLPLTGPATLVHDAALELSYARADGNDFSLDLTANGIQRTDGLLIDRIFTTASGTLDRPSDTEINGVAADVTMELGGFSSTDRALWDAVGNDADVTARIDWQTGSPLRLTGLDAVAGNLMLTGSAELDGLDTRQIVVATDLHARADDLDRFSAISGQKLGGSIDAAVKSRYDTVSAAFDIELEGRTRDLTLGRADADSLLAGPVDVVLDAARTAEGIAVKRLSLDGRRVALDGSAAIAQDGFPRAVKLTGHVGEVEGDPVILPIPGPQTSLQHALIDVNYDAATGDGFTLNVDGTNFVQEGVITLGTAKVTADGTLARDATTVTGATAKIAADLAGATAVDPALNEALAGGAQFSADLGWQDATDRIEIRNLALTSGALGLDGQADLTGLKSGTLALAASGDLRSGPLARFSALAGLPLSGSLDSKLTADYAVPTGYFDVALDGTAQDLTVGEPSADALFAGPVALGLSARRDAGGTFLDRLEVDGTRIALNGTAEIGADNWPVRVDLTGHVGQSDGVPVVLPIPDQVIRVRSADLSANYDAQTGDAFTLALDAKGFEQVGKLSVGTARLSADGTIARDGTTLKGATADVKGTVSGATSPDPGLAKALQPGADLSATISWAAGDRTLDVRDLSLVSGEARLAGEVDVTHLGAPEMGFATRFDAATGPLARFSALAGRQMKGSATASGSASYASDTKYFDADINIDGNNAGIGIAEADQILRGKSEVVFRGKRDADGITIETARVDTAELDLTATGGMQNEIARIDVDGRLRDLGLFAPGFNGPLTLKAAFTGQNGTWSVDGAITGPGGSTSEVKGDLLRPDGTMRLSANGSLPLGLANRFMVPRTLDGSARYDLTVNGKPGLDALSGTITVAGARLADPVTRFALEDIALNTRIARSRADLDLTARVPTGGQIAVKGPVTLTGDIPASITATMTRVRLENPQLYEINLDGRIAVEGPLAGGATISGRIDIGRSELRVPAGLSTGGTILDIQHVGEPASSAATRRRAGILASDQKEPASSGGGPAYPLDIVISAPNEIFVRGRGLDVELGGRIEIAGTTARPVPTGGLDLIRGHLDLLARRLQFEEARISLQGDLDPDIYMVATSDNAGVDARIIIEGPATDPELRFESSPELPQDEVLAQLFFGKAVQDLTPLEVAQLASAIRTLTGSGGEGIFGRAREALGVDQLSLGTDESGKTTVTAGRYLTEKVYTDVTVVEGGKTELQLNYEILPGFNARGSFDSAGDTGLGIVFEKDY